MLRDDLERELNNWALWRSAGGWAYTLGSAGLVSNYTPIATRYRVATVPVLAGSASDVDGVINRLKGELREALYAQYLRIDPVGRKLPASFTQAQIARALGAAARTFEARLSAARGAVGDGLHALRHRAAAREA